jgi:two-component system chemotaxis sensor kinase CheA
MDDIVKDFLVESCENLDRLDCNLVVLEKDPTSRDLLADIFRTIHTLKGTCGFLGFAKLESVAHAGENLLSRMRDGQLSLNPEITSALLAMVDAIRQMLASIEATGQDGDGAYTALLETLTRLSSSAPLASITMAAPSIGETPQNRLGEILVEEGYARPEDVTRAVRAQQSGDSRRLGEILVEQGAVQPQEVFYALQLQGGGRTPFVSDSTIRVDVGLLDKLTNLVGELVLARNQILQFTAAHKDTAFVATSQWLNLITTELQESVLKTRMQPIGNIWRRFPRFVRDLAITCGKQVHVEMEGQDTELDKTIIEAIKDPLTHLVRNAVDHGIEPPEERRAVGKSAEGCLSLKAFHEGGQVNIDVSDDGGGINIERIKHKALECDLITPEQAAHVSEREAVALVFLPGFSTVEKVTNVSGRGVGMDVVRTNIEKIGGTIEVQSKTGQGTTFRLKIPLVPSEGKWHAQNTCSRCR